MFWLLFRHRIDGWSLEIFFSEDVYTIFIIFKLILIASFPRSSCESPLVSFAGNVPRLPTELCAVVASKVYNRNICTEASRELCQHHRRPRTSVSIPVAASVTALLLVSSSIVPVQTLQSWTLYRLVTSLRSSPLADSQPMLWDRAVYEQRASDYKSIILALASPSLLRTLSGTIVFRASALNYACSSAYRVWQQLYRTKESVFFCGSNVLAFRVSKVLIST